MPSIFISHATADRSFVVREIIGTLKQQGIRSWYAPSDITTSQDWEKQIRKGLQKAQWFLVVMSPRSAKSEWVKAEVKWAVENRWNPERIVTVLLEECDLLSFHLWIPRLQYIDYRSELPEARQGLVAICERIRRSRHKSKRRGRRGTVQPEGESSEEQPAYLPPGVSESGDVMVTTDTASIEITINRDFDSYSLEEQDKLLQAIKSIIEADGDVRVTRKRRGSVKLTLAMTGVQAERLRWAMESGELDKHGVIGFRFADEQSVGEPPLVAKYGFRQQDLAREIDREINREDARVRFQEVCNDIFPPGNTPGPSPEHLAALQMMRLSRRIVNWTPEREPFECSLVLMRQSGDDGYVEATRRLDGVLSPLMEFADPIPFNLQNLDVVRARCELIQSSMLHIYVNVQDGRAHNVSVSNVTLPEGPKSRQEYYKFLAGRIKALLLYVRSGHIVEMYGSGDLQLYHDGFEWILSPYAILREACAAFFPRAQSEQGSALAATLAAVGGALLDAQRSSIWILVGDPDVPVLDELAKDGKSFTEMRPGLELSKVNKKVQVLPLPVLESIFKLDGAHALTSRGEIRYFARKIGEHLRPVDPRTDAPAQSSVDQTGTSGRAARDLAARLPHSIVIKFSSSGKIRVFKHNDLWTPPKDGKVDLR
ncbi:MAG TPA: toll/interleukin-1 receptor domain-containing protein [Gemmataceae bacterium]|jgi:hypothetical protein|nr:toll/interleukin-1 receptor domain-containing protein [Gemmataceae bacterium]